MKDFLDELDNELNTDSSTTSSDKKPQISEKTPSSDKATPDKTVNKQHTPYNKPSTNPGSKSITQDKKQHTKINTENRRNNTNDLFRGKFASNFPEIKFYLPTLREGYTRFIPIGGNNETGSKNMGMLQYGEEIVIIDCGMQFTDAELCGVNYSIPDVSFLGKYKDKIKGLVLTHAHLDHIGALKHILPALGMPTLYGTKLTIGLAKKSITEAGLLDKTTFVVADSSSEAKLKVGPFSFEFFGVNHSIPDSAGLYIESPGGAKFVHTGDFKIDKTPAIDKPFDLERLERISKKGITMLLSDSTGSTNKGFSVSEKDVGETLDEIIRDHKKGRLLIAAFSSWISRVQQLVDISEKYGKTIFLSGRSMIENVAIAKELGFINTKPGTIKKMTPKATAGIMPHNQIIITTGSQGEEFSALSRMSDGKHASVEILKGDTVIFSSSVVPGNETSVGSIINKLTRLGATVITKNNKLVHTGGHAYQEEQKVILNIVKPKYFLPVYGDLYFRTIHRKTAIDIGIKEDNILMLDNGNIVDFAPNGSVFRSKIKVPIQEIVIDGLGMGTANSHVIKAREKMRDSGVLVISYKVDKKTKAILGYIKLETRGLVYLEEVRDIHRMIIKKARGVYENTVKDVPDMEEKDLLRIIRTDLETFLLKRIDREPMIIPMMTEV